MSRRWEDTDAGGQTDGPSALVTPPNGDAAATATATA
eukprot:CAMPEP_0181022898 /NCGR_PEP_ID=MMETSP1070-20121207/1757_1 /TAXON_ID=265543 /ORGANISM="Minutocellus polymorphus, Strain NH13" /LENGTH=36 /DNA_ID= /DNA_START= /DNA_END= /DNA_ORIENTATION=